MAFTTIKIGDRDVQLKCSAATPWWFKQVFHFDLVRTEIKIRSHSDVYDRIEKAKNTNKLSDKDIDAVLSDIELYKKVCFIMAKEAERADFGKLTIADYYEWLSGFEEEDLDAVWIDVLRFKRKADAPDPVINQKKSPAPQSAN
jgi:hypothetical protein